MPCNLMVAGAGFILGRGVAKEFHFILHSTATTTATASRLRTQKLHIVLWGLHVGLVL